MDKSMERSRKIVTVIIHTILVLVSVTMLVLFFLDDSDRIQIGY